MLVNPEMANTQFLYRLKVQPGAVEKAKSYNSGYQGSMFPWYKSAPKRVKTLEISEIYYRYLICD
jgi:trehalose/maltose hydrolase-like predicted phosphorylase